MSKKAMDWYFKRMVAFCKKEQANDAEFCLELILTLIGYMNSIIREINQKCERTMKGPDFRNRTCKKCRQQGNDIKSCRLVAGISVFIDEAVYEDS